MPRTNTQIQEYLDHFFLNIAVATLGDASGLQPSATAGSVYVSLHTADPSAGTQSTSEATFTGYARQAVARSGSGWSRTSQTVSNVSVITYPPNTSGTNVITHIGIGDASSGSGKLRWVYALGSSITTTPTSNSIIQIAAGALQVSGT